MEYEQMILATLEEWKLFTTECGFHSGTFKDRTQEFKNWFAILPISCLYRNEEKDFILAYSDKHIATKAIIAALVLIIDDVVDNSTPAIIEVFDTNLINIGQKVTIYCNNKLHDRGIDLVSRIINFGQAFIGDSVDYSFTKMIQYFLQQVSLENNNIVEILLGVTISFDNRLLCAGTQGGSASIMVDSQRLKVELLDTVQQLGTNLDSLLALKNSINTTQSEVSNFEITSPLYLLACEIDRSDHIEKTGDLEWYNEISKTKEFNTRIQHKKVELYTSIPPLIKELGLDYIRFMDAFALIS